MTVFSCICDIKTDKILRLYCISGQSAIPIGVMTPCRNNLTLSKVFTKNALSSLKIETIDKFILSEKMPTTMKSTPESPIKSDWRPEMSPYRYFDDGVIENSLKNVKNALVSENDGTVSLAIPVSGSEPFPAMPIFCFGTFTEINGKSYMVFNLKDGKFI